MITVIPYEDQYQPDFKRLNLEWLEKYGLTEEYDLGILNNPGEKIIDEGGCIFLAIENGLVIGTAGLAKMNDTHYELVKMAVDPAARGKGTGKLLLQYCLNRARNLGAEKVSLFSSTYLKTALKMYEDAGFRYVDLTDSPMLTADIKMEISLITAITTS